MLGRDPSWCVVGDSRRIAAELAGCVSPATLIRCGEPMCLHTTIGVGGPADVYVMPGGEADLLSVLGYCRTKGVPVFVFGNGSNLVVRDGGLRGVVVQLGGSGLSRVVVRGRRIECEAGLKLGTLVAAACEHGLGGVEFLDGIPGTVGGALRMNAGAFGSAFFDVVEEIRYVSTDGVVGTSPAAALAPRYRGCDFFVSCVALGAVLVLDCVDAAESALRLERYRQLRRSSQPSGRSAGCVFKNPPGVSAGRLIDELGLKGLRIGGAMVSDKHANFIVTDPGARAADVLALIDLVRARVLAAYGVELELEVQVVGHE